MKLSCFVLHTAPQMDKLLDYIGKCPKLELPTVEYSLDRVSSRIFPPEFHPDLTFIDYETFVENHRSIYTLVRVSRYVAVIGMPPEINGFPAEGPTYYISYQYTYKVFTRWMRLVEWYHHDSLLHCPDFRYGATTLSSLETGAPLPVFTDEIIAVWMNAGICHIGLETETLICRSTFSELYTLFRNSQFMQVSEDMIINRRRISGLDWDVVRLANGMRVLLGFKFRKGFFNEIRPSVLEPDHALREWKKFFYSADESYHAKVRKGKLVSHLFTPR